MRAADMRRKYANPIQHTIYKDGWKDALHEVGDILEKRVTVWEDGETSQRLLRVDDLELELGKLVEGLR